LEKIVSRAWKAAYGRTETDDRLSQIDLFC